MNHNLIFLHLPKNGGTTFHSLLNRLYNKETVFTVRSITNSKSNEDEFIAMPEAERALIRLVKGHLIMNER